MCILFIFHILLPTTGVQTQIPGTKNKPSDHSELLQSSLFYSCSTRHPYLLHDKESLATVLEVVELGISGSKSQSRASDPPIFKEDKSPLPASRRVRDAAEGLLNLVLEEVQLLHLRLLCRVSCDQCSSFDQLSLVAPVHSFSILLVNVTVPPLWLLVAQFKLISSFLIAVEDSLTFYLV